MALLQMYYTSCPKGLSGTSGFQINAMSAGVEPDLLRTAIRVSCYAAPRAAPPLPSSAELATLPVSFFYTTLASGHVLLGQSVYLGRDELGRPGNYFAHCLIGSGADLRSTLPIELWRSAGWRSAGLPDGGELAPLEAPPDRGPIDRRDVHRLVQEPDNRAMLSEYLSAVESALALDQRVILIGAADEVARWVAVASYSFPRNLALRLSFDTYVRDPSSSDTVITGTAPDPRIDLRSMGNASVFALANRSAHPHDASAFVEAISEAWLGPDASKIGRSLELCEEIEPDIAVKDLFAAWNASRIALGERLTRDETVDAATWCLRRVHRLGPALVVQLLTSLAGFVDEGARQTASDLVIKVLLAGGTESRRACDAQLAESLGDLSEQELLMLASARIPVRDQAAGVEAVWEAAIRGASDPRRACALALAAHGIGLEWNDQPFATLEGKLAAEALPAAVGVGAVRRAETSETRAAFFDGLVGRLSTLEPEQLKRRLEPLSATPEALLEVRTRLKLQPPAEPKLAVAGPGDAPRPDVSAPKKTRRGLFSLGRLIDILRGRR